MQYGMLSSAKPKEIAIGGLADEDVVLLHQNALLLWLMLLRCISPGLAQWLFP